MAKRRKAEEGTGGNYGGRNSSDDLEEPTSTPGEELINLLKE